MPDDTHQHVINELKLIIENKLAEPSPPFVYAILLSAKLKTIAVQIENLAIKLPPKDILDAQTRTLLAAEVDKIRAASRMIEECELRWDVLQQSHGFGTEETL